VLIVTATAHPVALVVLLWAASRGQLPAIYAAAALAGATFLPLTGAIRGAWNGLTDPRGSHAHLRVTALAAEMSLFEIVFIAGPLLVGLFIAFATPGRDHVLGGGHARRHPDRGARCGARPAAAPARGPHCGLGPCGCPGLVLLICAGGLGAGFGVRGGGTRLRDHQDRRERGEHRRRTVRDLGRGLGGRRVLFVPAPRKPRCTGSSPGCSAVLEPGWPSWR
jgi:hypothetical protein